MLKESNKVNRKMFLGLLILVFVLSACSRLQEMEIVRGSGAIASEARAIEGVRGVTLATLGDLIIEVGEEEGLTIEAEENLLPYLETTVRGGVLTIGSRQGVSLVPSETVTYYLTVTGLESLAVTSSGNIEAPPLEGERFTVESSSSGDIHLQGLEAERLDVEIGSSGDIVVDEGQVAHEEIRIHSSGAFSADDVQCQSASVEITSSGNAHIWVSDSLDADLSSSGDLNYYGDAQVEQSTSSSGKVVSLGAR